MCIYMYTQTAYKSQAVPQRTKCGIRTRNKCSLFFVVNKWLLSVSKEKKTLISLLKDENSESLDSGMHLSAQ